MSRSFASAGAVSKRLAAVFLLVVAIATLVVAVVRILTNRMHPEWDMHYYLDMAINGLRGNKDLAAPFAYRPAMPLVIGGIAHLLHVSPERTFHICAFFACVAFIVSCFYFARSIGASQRSAIVLSVALALYFSVVKWTLFAGTMVDIYAYPLILLGFWMLWNGRIYGCLIVSAIGLFFKEFMLLPLATQAAFVTIRSWRTQQRRLWTIVGLTILILLTCFLLPRLLIHVSQTFQDIDPINQSSTLQRLLYYPESRRRDFNILFAYLSCWLPVLLLITRERLVLVWTILRPYRLLLALYLFFHFALVLYGGTNLTIFVTYSLPVQIVVLATMLDKGNVPFWEQALMLLVVILFNRIWMPIPLPDNGLDRYLDFYGGYHMLVTPRSFYRMTELLAYIFGFWLVRAVHLLVVKPQTNSPQPTQRPIQPRSSREVVSKGSVE